MKRNAMGLVIASLSLIEMGTTQVVGQPPPLFTGAQFGTTTYTVAQILERQNTNWDKLRDVQFMVVKVHTGTATASPGGTAGTNGFPITPRVLPERIPITSPREPTHGLQTIQNPSSTTVISYKPLNVRGSLAREILIAGMADHSKKRGVSIVLSGQSAEIYRRRSGNIFWTGEVQATIVDGLSMRAYRYQATPQPRINRRGKPLPNGHDIPVADPKSRPLAPPPYIDAMDFHPRHLTDLPFLVKAWQENIPVSRVWKGPDQLQVTTQSPEGQWTAVLIESASFLPQQVIFTKYGNIMERRDFLLREVGGVWLAGRCTIYRANGTQEAWYYQRYSANQGLPSRGVSPEFLLLPEETEKPDWLTAQIPSLVPSLPTPPSLGKTNRPQSTR
jgi:hypothetical protein